MRLSRIKTYTLEITHQELLLISKALGGRLRQDEDHNEVEEAKDLDVQLGRNRIAIVQQDQNEIQPIIKKK